MPSRTQLIPTIFACIFFAVILFIGDRVGVLSIIGNSIEVLVQPLQKLVYKGSVSFSASPSLQAQQLQKENQSLRMQLAKQQAIESDNKALHDQFVITTPSPKQLLPATVIGAPGFLPGITKPETLIIDKGSNDNVHLGATIIYQDNLIGQISKVTLHEAEVTLVSNKVTAFPAKTQHTNALGILRGEGNGEMILDNVVLSDTLQKGDIVVTKGDSDGKGKGFLPNLVIGKIIAINKKASNIFQSAEVASLVDTSRINDVFIQLHE